MVEERFKQFTRGAWRKFWSAVKGADVIVEVLDPRDPPGFRFEKIESRLVEMGKKVILVINKADLVPRKVLDRWKKVFSEELPTVYISARYRLGTGELRKIIIRSVPREKKIINVAVVGYPNVGKSTIINILKGSHSAPTGSKPGLTRHTQIIRRGRLKIFDTPGVFPIENEIDLVYKGAIRVEKLDDPIYYCSKLLDYILKIDANSVYRSYSIQETEPMKIIEKFALLRKKLRPGGVPDLETAAKMIIKDWQDGKLIAWRTPNDPKSKHIT
ncbi:MAG: GTPase [Candidatus Njordarchaeia archaeon]